MGHTQRRAVLLFYAWASVIGFGALIAFLVPDPLVAILFIVVGMLVCTVLTAAPLASHRKRLEAQAQRSPYGDDDDMFDPLDALGVEHADRVRRAPAAPFAPKARILGASRRVARKLDGPRHDAPDLDHDPDGAAPAPSDEESR